MQPWGQNRDWGGELEGSISVLLCFVPVRERCSTVRKVLQPSLVSHPLLRYCASLGSEVSLDITGGAPSMPPVSSKYASVCLGDSSDGIDNEALDLS